MSRFNELPIDINKDIYKYVFQECLDEIGIYQKFYQEIIILAKQIQDRIIEQKICPDEDCKYCEKRFHHIYCKHKCCENDDITSFELDMTLPPCIGCCKEYIKKYEQKPLRYIDNCFLDIMDIFKINNMVFDNVIEGGGDDVYVLNDNGWEDEDTLHKDILRPNCAKCGFLRIKMWFCNVGINNHELYRKCCKDCINN